MPILYKFNNRALTELPSAKASMFPYQVRPLIHAKENLTVAESKIQLSLNGVALSDSKRLQEHPQWINDPEHPIVATAPENKTSPDLRVDKLVDVVTKLTETLDISGARKPRHVSGSKSSKAKVFTEEAQTVRLVPPVVQVEGKSIFNVEDVTQVALAYEHDNGHVDNSTYEFLKHNESEKLVFKSEEKFVEFLTPTLNLLFEGRILVNSERIQWLRSRVGQDDRKTDQKPAWFLVDHKAFFTKIDKDYTPHVCGKLSSWILRDTADIIEAKLSSGNDGLTETVEYGFDLAQHCLESDCVHCERKFSRAMLVYPKGFTLITTTDKKTLSIEKFAWNTSGSWDHVQQFFQSTDLWAKSLTEACTVFGCELGDVHFVGSGGTGRVFQVKVQGISCALKLVSGSFVNQLDDEHATMLDLCNDAKIDFKSVVAAPSNFKRLETSFAAMLMPLGEMVLPAHVTVLQVKLEVFAAMCMLHALGCTHGDPRLDNLIRVNGKLCWIDFMGGKKMHNPRTQADEQRRKNDLTILVVSITGEFVTSEQKLAIDASNPYESYVQLANTVVAQT